MGGSQKYHLTWSAQAEICPNKAWEQLLVSTRISITNFCQALWWPLCSRSSQNDVIYSFPDSFKFVLRLFLNLNYKYWAYFSLNTSCQVVFLASTCLITIISTKTKVTDNFQLKIFFILGPDLENQNANIKNNYIGSGNKIYNKIYAPIDP